MTCDGALQIELLWLPGTEPDGTPVCANQLYLLPKSQNTTITSNMNEVDAVI